MFRKGSLGPQLQPTLVSLLYASTLPAPQSLVLRKGVGCNPGGCKLWLSGSSRQRGAEASQEKVVCSVPAVGEAGVA